MTKRRIEEREDRRINYKGAFELKMTAEERMLAAWGIFPEIKRKY